MNIRTLTAVAAALLATPTFADTFQAEAGLFYRNSDADMLASDVDTFAIAGSVFLKPVDDSKGPLLEAAFLDRASGVTASWADPDSPFDEFVNIGGRFVTANGIIVEAGYSDFLDDDTYRVGLGTYLSATSDVVVSYTNNDDADIDTLTVAYHAIRKLGGTAAIGWTVNGGFADASDNGYILGGTLTYYPAANLGFGVTADVSDFNNTDKRTVGLQASYFINPRFFVQGFVSNTDYDGPDEDTYGVSASVRF